jgi:hypothetical protein
VQDLTAVKDSPPLVPEDHAARQVRCFSVSQEKKEKDAAKKRRNRKILEREALIKRRHKQRLEGLPEEESPLRRPWERRMRTTMMMMMMLSRGTTP